MPQDVSIASLKELALRTYRQCRDCEAKEFSFLAPNALSLYNTLLDAEDYVSSKSLAISIEERLQSLLTPTQSALETINKQIGDYNSLTPTQRREWQETSWQNEEEENAREQAVTKLNEAADDFSTFYRELTRPTERKIERALEKLIDDDEKSNRLQDAATGGVKDAWSGVVRDFESLGIRRDVAGSHRVFVVEWVRRAQSDGKLRRRFQDSVEEDRHTKTQSLQLPKTTLDQDIDTQMELPPNCDEENSDITEVSPVSQSPLRTTPTELKSDTRSETLTNITTPDGSPNLNQRDTKAFSSPRFEMLSANAPEVVDQSMLNNLPVSISNKELSIASPGRYSVRISRDADSIFQQALDPGFASLPRASGIFTKTSFKEGDTEKQSSLVAPPVPPKIPSSLTPVVEQPQTPEAGLIPQSLQSPQAGLIPHTPQAGLMPQTSAEPSSVSPSSSLRLSRSVSIDGLPENLPLDDERPPSPLPPLVDMCEIAGDIITAWNVQDWSKARRSLQEQIDAVENGLFIEVSGISTKPDVRLLRHLQGICYSYEGNFIDASKTFQNLVRSGEYFDEGDVAAARWLGETCIMLNEPQNAALAWATSLCGLIRIRGYTDATAIKLAENLRVLNQATNGLSVVRMYAMSRNMDITTIMGHIDARTKFNLINEAMGLMCKHLPAVSGSGQPPARLSSLELTEGFLIQPLVAQLSFPMPMDPFFRTQSAIALLYILTRPKTIINVKDIPSVRKAKSLMYKTKRPGKWLVESVREALNTYQLEWKVLGSTVLVRLAQTYNRIAYYECFSIRFYKVALRKCYGIKVTATSHMSRTFEQEGDLGKPKLEFDVARQQEIIRELSDRLSSFLVEKERQENGEKDSADLPELSTTEAARFEMAAPSSLPPELMASTEQPVELDGRRPRFWKRKDPPPGVFELAA